MCQNCQQVTEQLGINIALFFERLDAGSNSLREFDKEIICQSLLGYSRQDIATTFNLPGHSIRDRLRHYIYPKIAEMMQVDQERIAGNWVMILNLLLKPNNGYKLNPAPQLNSDNFQGSFGREFFLYPPNQRIVQAQIEGTQF